MSPLQKPAPSPREEIANALLGLRCERRGCDNLATCGTPCSIQLAPHSTHLLSDDKFTHYHLHCDRHRSAADVPLSKLSYLRIVNGHE